MICARCKTDCEGRACPGPLYPHLPNVAKFRKIPKDRLTQEQKDSYSEALTHAIRTLQYKERQREVPAVRPNCVSGTRSNRAEDIEAAIYAQNNRALLNYPSFVRRNRTAEKWEDMYKAAMKEKRTRCK